MIVDDKESEGRRKCGHLEAREQGVMSDREQKSVSRCSFYRLNPYSNGDFLLAQPTAFWKARYEPNLSIRGVHLLRSRVGCFRLSARRGTRLVRVIFRSDSVPLIHRIYGTYSADEH